MTDKALRLHPAGQVGRAEDVADRVTYPRGMVASPFLAFTVPIW